MLERPSSSGALAVLFLFGCAGEVAPTPGSAGGMGGVGGSGGSSAGSPPAGGSAGGRGLFQTPAPWYADISAAPLDRESAEVLAGLQARGGFGTGSVRIDFSITVLHAPPSVASRAFQRTADFYMPDCDQVPVPLPTPGRLEGESSYACSGDGDCHLIVQQGRRLYEMWRANITGGQAEGGTFFGGCLAVWDLDRDHWSSGNTAHYGRGDQCTSADAGGLPIADLTVRRRRGEGGRDPTRHPLHLAQRPHPQR